MERERIIEALKICDSNYDGVVCEKCPIKDEDYNGSWYDEDGDCYQHLMREAAELLSEQSAIQPEKAQLSKEGTTKDTISRQQAIDAVEKNACNTQRIMDAVNNLPSAQSEPQWIPVSERLPEDLEEVNVTWVNRNPESYYESIKDKPFTATAVYYKGKWYWWSTYTQDLLAEYGERCNVGLLHEAIEVTAWMPLPEPYQKGATP